MRNEVREGYPVADFGAVWEKYRKYFWISIAMFVGWMPFGVVIIGGLERWNLNWAVFPAIAIYIVAMSAASIKASGLRCPRCGSRFFEWGPFGAGHNPFARKCGNCGLKKWQCQTIAEAIEGLKQDEY